MAESVKTLKSSLGDYTSVQTWWDTECDDYDCVTNTTSPVLECYDDWAGGKSEQADLTSISGYAANSSHHPILRAATGEGHGGTPGTGFKLKYATSYTYVVRINAAYTEVSGIEAEHTGTGDGIEVAVGTGVAKHCIAKEVGSSATRCAIKLDVHGATAIGCLAYDSARGIGAVSSYKGPVLKNNVASNCSVWGFKVSGSSSANVVIQNSVAYSCGTSFDSPANIDASSGYNAASDGATTTPPGSNPYTSNVVSGDFADAANDDFHLSSSSGLIDQGVNLYSDFTTDIDGDTWPSSGAWDIGFDFYASSGASYTLTAALGTFSESGQAAGLKADRKLTSAQGTFSHTGQSAGLKIGRMLTSSAGAFTLTGVSAGLKADRNLTSAVGSFVLAGQDATLTYTPASGSYTLVADSGSVVLTGQAASLTKALKVAADQAGFTLTGQDIAFRKGYSMASANGSFALTGVAAAFARSRSLAAYQGSYSLTGQAAAFDYESTVVWSAASSASTTWTDTTDDSTTWTEV